MSWWNSVSADRLVVTVSVDEHFTPARSTYTEATRRIERGNIEAFAESGRCVSIYLVSGTHFVRPEPTPLWGNLLPGNLDRDIRNSADGRVHTSTISTGGALPGFGELRLHSPSVLNTRLALPPSAVVQGLNLREPWSSFFPGGAATEYWLLKQQLEQLAARPATVRRDIATTMARERTASIVLPSELPLWDLRAAEDQEEVLADARDQFGLPATSWPGLRASEAFLARIQRPMSALGALGWSGVVWLQLQAALTDVGFCTHPGCDRPLSTGRRLYCDPHAESSARDKARLRQRRKRGRRPPYSPS